jgi:hypothetical protein
MVSSKERTTLPLRIQWLLSAVSTVLVLLCLSSSTAFAACHAVTPTGSGTKTGADWNNALAWPLSFVRGDVYYLADGTYAALDFKVSGTATVEIRKAQSYDNGSSCSPSIAAGWNASTMGVGQAVFNTLYYGHQFYLESPGLLINGNGQQTTPGCGGAVGNNPAIAPAAPTDCGIKIDNSSQNTTDLISGPTGAASFTAKYVEIFGSGQATYENYLIRADNSTGTTLTHMYIHRFGAVCAVVGGASNFTFTYNYMFRNQTTPGSNPSHGQCLQSFGDGGNFEVSRNVFRDLGGTAIMMAWVGSGSVQSGPYRFYDNVIWNTPGYTPAYPSANGLLACINGFTCNNVTMSNNTIAGAPGQNAIDSETGGTYTVQNNIWYSSSGIADPNPHGTFTEDHNSYLVSGTGCPTGTANVCDNAASNPFANWAGGDFTLASDLSDWNNRLELGSPYSMDAAGIAFTTDRGAYQNVAFGGPVPPTGLAALVQ